MPTSEKSVEKRLADLEKWRSDKRQKDKKNEEALTQRLLTLESRIARLEQARKR